MENKNRITVIIVNYKTANLTINCIKSLIDQIDPNKDKIVVVDNNSGNEEVVLLKQMLKDDEILHKITLVELNENNGFSAGNNAGITLYHSQFYLLTNSDTEFLPKAISELLKAADKYPEAGIISPRLEWPNGIPQVSCFRYHSPFSELIRAAGTGYITSLLKKYNVPIAPVNDISRPEWTSFACVLIRDAVIQTIGLLDDKYFMYFEDVDFCRRARSSGYDVLNWPEAKVVHFQGKSSDVKKRTQSKKKLPDYYYFSRSRYYIKFYKKNGYLFSNMCWLIGRTISALREMVSKKCRTVPQNEITGIWLVK